MRHSALPAWASHSSLYCRPLSTALGISQKQLASLFEIDSTNLTPALEPLRRVGWLRSSEIGRQLALASEVTDVADKV
jgi:hypothetical protein